MIAESGCNFRGCRSLVVRNDCRIIHLAPTEQCQPPRQIEVISVPEIIRICEIPFNGSGHERFSAEYGACSLGSENNFPNIIPAIIKFAVAFIDKTARPCQPETDGIDNFSEYG